MAIMGESDVYVTTNTFRGLPGEYRRTTMKQKVQNKKGFTLIELMITVTIIGILAGIAIPLFLGQRTRAAQSEARSNLTSLRLIEEQVFADNGFYLPNPAATATGLAAIQDPDQAVGGLVRFQPGPDANLNYTYEVTTTDTTGDGRTDTFIAWARPKAGSSVEGTQDFYINSNNINNF
jgi:type IV pilus assembly protein PilA